MSNGQEVFIKNKTAKTMDSYNNYNRLSNSSANYSNLSSLSGVTGQFFDVMNTPTDSGERSVPLSALGGAAQGAMAGAALGPIGMAAGAVLGGVAGAVQTSKNNEQIRSEQQRQKSLEAERKARIDMENSKAILSTFPSYGVDTYSLYTAKGGTIPQYRLSTGGIIPLRGAKKFVGNSHENGGIGIIGTNGRKIAEVEGGEIEFEDQYGEKKVLSKRDGYADLASNYMKTPEYQEELMEYETKHKENKESMKTIRDKFGKGTFQRNQQKLRHPLQAVFDEQEANKTLSSGTKLGHGGMYPKDDFLWNDAPYTGDPMPYAYNLPLLSADVTYGNANTTPPLPTGTPFMTNEEELAASLKNIKSKGITAQPVTQPALNFTPINLGTNTTTGTTTSTDGTNSTVQGTPAGKLGTVNSMYNMASAFIPFIDNIANRNYINKTPQVPVMEPYKAMPLVTRLNYNPAFAQVDRTVRAGNRNLEQYSPGLGTMLGNKTKLYADALYQKSNLAADKINKETGLINSSRLNAQGIDNKNTEQTNNTKLLNMQRDAEIISKLSQNTAEGVESAMTVLRERNLKEYDKKRLAIIKEKYKTTGVLTRLEQQELIDLLGTNPE